METTQIFAFLGSVPTWGWVIVVLFVLFAAGDRILWDYEVKFPLKEGVGRGKVELEGKKKKGPCIECMFELEKPYQNQTIHIFLNGQEIYQVKAEKNNSRRFRLSEHIQIPRPNEADKVSVHIGGKEIFSGLLALD